MRGLDPRIHFLIRNVMDCRVSPLCGGPAMTSTHKKIGPALAGPKA
jgi:hypothetical protein